MLDIYNRDRKKIAVLENATNCVEFEKLNAVSTFEFALPTTDPKNQYCTAFNLLRWGDNGQYYRILDTETKTGGENDLNIYYAEHVIGVLIDGVVFGTWEQLNLTTRDVLTNILARQKAAHWVLGDCDFERRFSYSWSNENLLAALFSVPNRFDQDYMWVFDTSRYPWVVHLKKLDTAIDPGYYIRAGRNLLASYQSKRGRNVCNRIYALGYGEGINQLTIKDVNAGVPYVEDVASIAQYGLVERIWEDLRFENSEALKQRALVLLDGYKKPYETYEFQVADLEKMTGAEIDRATAGKVVRFGDTKTYIIAVTRRLQEVGNDDLVVANKPEDIASTIAELANRQRINSVYANGATNIYAQSFNDNADLTHPAVLDFYIPSEARQINKVVLTFELGKFRAYETGATSVETTTRSTTSGGASSQTSASGGGGASTSGPSTRTSVESYILTGEQLYYPEGGGRLPPAQVGSQNHTHRSRVEVYIDHTHEVDMPSHRHQFSIPAHSHDFTVPGHTHSIVHGIFEGPSASTAQVLVDGKAVPLSGGQTEINLVDYLSVDGGGKIRRGAYHRIEITPLPATGNAQALTRITATVTVQLFIQSEGGGNY